MGMKVTTVLYDFGLKNGKGSVINGDVMKEAVEKYIEKHNGSSVIYGETNPSDYPMAVSLGSISHKADLRELDFSDDKISCDIEINDTPNGKIVQELVNLGNKPTFAPRMVGEYIYETDEEGNRTEKIIGIKDPMLISIDII